MSTPNFKCAIYIFIAVLTALSAELEHIQAFTNLSIEQIFKISISIIIQGVVAWKAFLDQSISNKDSN